MAKEIWYPKLVRDPFPALIKAQKESPVTRTLGEEAFIKQLQYKWGEEVAEFLQAKEPEQQLEELADILEAAYAFTAAKEELKKIRLEKAQRKGTFKGQIFLKKDSSWWPLTG